MRETGQDMCNEINSANFQTDLVRALDMTT